MKIVFEKLKMHNFMSFGDAEIILNKSGYISIKGINNNLDDSATSNGSGKSAIFEAISWCLTGTTIRGSKDVVNIKLGGTAEVELSFTVDNDKYILTRTKDPSNLKLYVNSDDKSGKGIRDTEIILKEYLPDLTADLLGSVIILGQGLPNRLTNNTPSGRKDILEKLSKSDFMMDDIKNRLSLRKSELSTEVREKEDDCLKKSTEISVKTSALNDNKIKLESITSEADIKSHIESEKLLLESYESAKESLEIQLEDISKDKIVVDELIEEELANIQASKDNIKNKYSNETLTLTSSITEKSTELKLKKSELTKLKSIKDVCPTCGQKLIGVEKPDTGELENYIIELESLVNNLNLSLSELKQAEKDEYASISLDKYNSYVSSKNTLENTIKDVTDEINVKNSGINNCNVVLSKLNSELGSIESRKKELSDSIINLENEINELNSTLLYINNEKDILNEKLSIINKISSLITRDFRGYLLINIIEYINNKCKEYCKDIFETDKIEFKQDKNNISISYCDKEYENLSGGEKQKIDLIIQLAIRSMLCTYLNFSSNIIVLDEIVDFLDKQGADRVINFISNKLSDVSTIYFVTHHDDLLFPYDQELIVTKNSEGISSVI